MPKKEPQTKGEVTRLTIEDAALALFMKQGYHATSMRQIAEQAGLALGSIYNHFASKDEIFEAIIIDKHPYKKVLPAILEAQGDSAEEFFKNALHIVIAELGKEPYYINLMFIEFVEFKGKHATIMLREIAPKILPVMEKIIQTRKSIRVTNPAMLVRTFFGLIISYYITEMIVNNSVIGDLMPKDTVDAYADIYLHGILK
ncbi:MAG: TetR/AcrR family transcriptional regulator [Anaerolineales bacterium]|nr:TetR/AcrR family transcriptional regulator [Anaerolineales bacterium]